MEKIELNEKKKLFYEESSFLSVNLKFLLIIDLHIRFTYIFLKQVLKVEFHILAAQYRSRTFSCIQNYVHNYDCLQFIAFLSAEITYSHFYNSGYYYYICIPRNMCSLFYTGYFLRNRSCLCFIESNILQNNFLLC